MVKKILFDFLEIDKTHQFIRLKTKTSKIRLLNGIRITYIIGFSCKRCNAMIRIYANKDDNNGKICIRSQYFFQTRNYYSFDKCKSCNQVIMEEACT